MEISGMYFFLFVLSDMSLSLLPKQLIAKIVQFCM